MQDDCISMTASQPRAGLQSEALAFVDLLVLLRARRFVGFGLSTFTWAVLEQRCLLGISPASTSMPAVSLNRWMDLSVTTVLSDHDVSCPSGQERGAHRYEAQ